MDSVVSGPPWVNSIGVPVVDQSSSAFKSLNNARPLPWLYSIQNVDS